MEEMRKKKANLTPSLPGPATSGLSLGDIHKSEAAETPRRARDFARLRWWANDEIEAVMRNAGLAIGINISSASRETLILALMSAYSEGAQEAR